MESSNKQHLKGLDGLKGIGACIVAFAWHYQHFQPQAGSPFHRFIPVSYDYGWCMVELFFMLSGFGMMMGYSKRVFNNEISFKDFILKRVKKLYPIFLFTTALTILFELLYYAKMGETFVYPNFDLYHLFLNLFFIQDGYLGIEVSFNAPSWCISICIFCYIMFYFIIYRVKEERHIYYCFAATALVGLFIIISGINYAFFNSLIGRGISCFSIGVILSRVYQERENFKSKKLGYFSLALVVFSYLLVRYFIDKVGNFQMAFIIGIAPLIILSVLFVPWVNLIVGCKPFEYLGKISIGIYLFHFPVQCLIKVIDKWANIQINYSSHLFWTCYVVAVICFASLYKLVVQERYEKMVLNFFSISATK